MKFLGWLLVTSLVVAVLVFLPHILPGSALTLHGWDYERGVSSNGLDTWGNVSAYCMGSSQSPVDLDALEASHDHHHHQLMFKNYEEVAKENIAIENNGHAVELKLTSAPIGAAMMFGGPLVNSHQLLQLHFHWGKWNGRGSEHTINGERFPMEMHLVHQASSLEWGVESATSPVNIPDGLAVAAFLWKISETDNEDLNPIIEMLGRIKKAGSQTELESNLKISSLISPAMGPYFSYHGSLTTPGCNEVVHWIVFRTPLSISKRQLRQFRKVFNSKGSNLVDNFRPTQPLNNRTVTLYA